MKTLLKTIPIPINGLMLGLVSLANLFFALYLEFFGFLFFSIGFVLFLLMLFKIAFTFLDVINDIKNPIIASVAPTFSMGMMVICSVLAGPFSLPGIATIGWRIAACVHFTLVIYFIYTFIWKNKFELHSIYPSWFIVFVGIGVIPITSGNEESTVVHLLFWLGFIFYLILLPIVWLRLKYIEEPARPLLTIIAAPGSLCLTAYLVYFTQHNVNLVVFLLVLSQLIYAFVLFKLPTLLKLPFFPSYAAFTFPLVISATAMNASAHFFDSIPALKVLTVIELLIATCIVSYVFVRYVLFIIERVHARKANGV